ncbi:MAG: 7-cyano-7-deazaguanine synthase [Thermodesulfobacteriota bacterium]|nr:7-cyano-7-deazaguanine synthase [Thermodesulfobacteriota bacterium]
MCGIFGFFSSGSKKANVSAMNRVLFNVIGMTAQERGTDGFGYMVESMTKFEERQGVLFSDSNLVSANSRYGMINCRAKPETEIETDVNNIQPLVRNNHWLVHNGALSQSYNAAIFKRTKYKPRTDLDSEGLMCLMSKPVDLEDELSKVDGGFAFIHMKTQANGRLFVTVSCKYQPLYHLRIDVVVRGHHAEYHYFHSCESAIDLIEESFKCRNVKNIFFNKHEVKPYSYQTFIVDFEKGIESIDGTFIPKFQYPNLHMKVNKIKVLCASSSGIDSTTSLMLADKLLKESNVEYSIDAVHFKYGHRGQEAELYAMKRVIAFANKRKKCNFNLKICNLERIYKSFFKVKNSQLIDKESTIETGTKDMLKSTIAWVPVRNMLFQTLLTGLAETYILEEGYDKVYIIAGWNQLSEEGFYPDNSARFSNAMSEAGKYGTLVGHRIHQWKLCSNLLKSDQWLLAQMFGFLDVFKYTISCDIPIIEKDGDKITGVFNCAGQCGSTLLSMWASERYKDIKDPRRFKEADVNISKDDLYELPKGEPIEHITDTMRSDVLDRIIKIPEVL